MVGIDIGGFRQFLSALFPAPDTFLRELVQNAMEALNAAAAITGNAEAGRIDIDIDQHTPSITVRDNGCGMAQDELELKLGTVFRSGWGDLAVDTLGVGQFGFGFFSSILVSDRVEVRTRPLGDRGETSAWEIDCKSGATRVSYATGTLASSGFVATLELSDEFRYLASSDYISRQLKNYLLFCPFHIFVSGTRLEVPTRAQWQRTLKDARSEAFIAEDVQRAFHWGEAPIAVHTSDYGVLATTPSGHSAPPTKIYRHGVFVLETEIIPLPLNYIFCGIFNVDSLRIRPDRESFVEDGAYEAFRRDIVDQVRTLVREILTSPEKSAEFFREWLDPLVASVVEHDQLSDLRLDIPLRRVTAKGVEISNDTSWRRLAQKLQTDRILFSRDTVADRGMLEFFRGGNELVVHISNPREHRLVVDCAHEGEIRLVEISEAYVEGQRYQSVDSPELNALFSSLPSSRDHEFIFVSDHDERFPIRLLRETNELDGMMSFLRLIGGMVDDHRTLSESWAAIVNLSHPAIEVLVAGLQVGASRERLRNGADVLLLTARMSVAEVSVDEQVELARALGELMSHAIDLKSKGRWPRLFN